MEIIRTDKEYKEEQEKRKKINQQRMFCPCCKRKRSWITRFINDIFCGHLTYYFYKCKCIKCGAVWVTDERYTFKTNY